MYRYKIIIEYDGTGKYGWQYQPDQKTIQGLIQNAIFTITKEQVNLIGSGRTDAGVHAISQVGHFDLNQYFDPNKLRGGINHFTHYDYIAIKEVDLVENSFHARYSVLSREYKYIILNRKSIPALDKNRVLWIIEKLDITIMQEALQQLIGTHDFSSFRASQCGAKSPITTLYEAYIQKEEEYISIYFKGKFFLQHMIRNIVGLLVNLGLSKISLKDFIKIFHQKDREISAATASPSGLYLLNINYE